MKTMRKILLVISFMFALFIASCGNVTIVKKDYTVRFLAQGTIVSTQYLNAHEDAVAPEDPVIDGYIFVGWDKDFTDVQSDLLVKGIFEDANVSNIEKVHIDANYLKAQYEGKELGKTLRTEGQVYGSRIKWTYPTSALRVKDGQVDCLVDQIVNPKLVATIINGNAVAYVEFEFAGTLNGTVASDAFNIELEMTQIDSELISSVPVVTDSAFGTTIKYSSSNEDVAKVEDGWLVINRQNADVTVEITVQLTNGSVTETKVYEVLVPAGTTEMKDFNVTYVLGLTGATNTTPTTHKVGTTVDLTDAIAEGYIFRGWYTDQEYTNEITQLPLIISEDLKLYAKFEKVSLTDITVEVLNAQNYNAKENFNRDSIKVTAHYTNGTTEVVTDYTVNKTQLHAIDTKVEVSYAGIVKEVQVNVAKLPAPTDVVTAALTQSYVYDGKEHSAIFSFNSRYGLIYSMNVENNTSIKNVGSKQVTLSFTTTDTDYEDISNVVITLSVTKRPITVVAETKAITYNGLIYTPVVTANNLLAGDTLENLGVDVIYGTIKNAGTYAVTIDADELNENYSITATNGQITVNKAPLTLQVENHTKTYDGQAYTPVTKVLGLVNGETLEDINVTVNNSPVTNAGTYEIKFNVLTASTNYEYNVTNGTIKVNKAPLTLTATDYSKTYDGQAYTPVTTVLGLVNGETLADINVTVNNTPVTNVGTYQVKFDITNASANYEYSVTNATVKVTPKAITLTATPETVTYDGQNHQLALNTPALVAGETLESIGVVVTNPVGKNAGTYTVSYDVTNASANYTYNVVSATLTINPKEVTLTGVDTTITYNGQSLTTYTVDGLLAGDTLENIGVVVSNPVVKNAGIYAITFNTENASANYTYEVTAGTVTINKKALFIAPNDESIYRTETLPVFTWTVSGLVDGETEESLELNITAKAMNGSVELTDTNTVGSYAIVLNVNTTNIEQNYDITVDEAELVIRYTVQELANQVFAEIEVPTTTDENFTLVSPSSVTWTGGLSGVATLSGNNVTVTRPDYWTGDKTVTFTAKVTIEGQNFTKSYSVKVLSTPKGNAEKFDLKQVFTNKTELAKWSTTYAAHVVNFDIFNSDVSGTISFASANKQQEGNSIYDIPVSKGSNAILHLDDFAFSSLKLTFKQWTTKTQTFTVQYSTDGLTYTTITSKSSLANSIYTVTVSSIPANATFIKVLANNSNNQIGWASIDFTYTTIDDQYFADYAFSQITSKMPSIVNDDFVLPTVDGITWSVAANSYVSVNGNNVIVTRPTSAEGDKVVTFIATFTKGSFTDVEEFNVTIEAELADNINVVTFDNNYGSIISEVEVEDGNTVTKPTDPTRSGYKFNGWYTDSTCTTAYDFSTAVTTSFTLYAKWTISATSATISFASTAQRLSQTTTKQVWSNGGITFTNNKAASSSNVANYSNPVRLYANSEIVVESEIAIKSIVFTVSGSSYATPLKNSIGTPSGATVTVSGNNITVTFNSAVTSYTIAKLTAQVRLKSLTVNFA